MIRMWVDRARFQPAPAAVERLLPVEVGELNRLYQLGFAAWLPSSTIAEGIYYGIRVNGRLVAAAGTHVISRNARLAVVGNVLTHTDHRGRGYAQAVDLGGDRGAAPVLRPGRAQRPVRQPAGDPGLPRSRLHRALPVRGAPDPPHRLAVGGPDRAAPPPVLARLVQPPRLADRDAVQHASRPSTTTRPIRSTDRPAVRRRPARGTPMTDTTTPSRTTSPTSPSPPRACAASSGPSARCPSCASSASDSSARSRSPACGSAPASTSPPRPRT